MGFKNLRENYPELFEMGWGKIPFEAIQDKSLSRLDQVALGVCITIKALVVRILQIKTWGNF